MFEMVSFPAFNDSMFMWSLPDGVPFFISRSAASTCHDSIAGTLVSVDYGSLSYSSCKIPLFFL